MRKISDYSSNSSANKFAEYDDDTAIVPRSTTVIAKRMPAAKAGRGGAARYVSGKMPVNAKNSHRQETHPTKPSASGPINQPPAMNGAQTEEEKIQAIFKMGADQWAQDQQQMAKYVQRLQCSRRIWLTLKPFSATPIHRGGPMKGKPQNLPDHPPPPGYICYRCGEKGHWIQACPTNNDPTFDGRPRVKRTTGIPRSFLKTVEKPTALANDGTVDDTKQPSGIMVNAEGEWVIAEPDKAAWDKFQAKAKVSAEAQQAAAQGSKELQGRGLECSIDKRLFVDPVKTPCCEKTFCRECIANALVDNDLKCPECSTEDVPIDNLFPDTDTVDKIRQYEEEEISRNISKENSLVKVNSEYPEVSQYGKESKSPSPQKSLNSKNGLKKRAPESELENDHKPPGPTESISKQPTPDPPLGPSQSNPNIQRPVDQQLPFSNGIIPDVTAMMMPNMNGYMGMPNMGAMGINAMFNPMMMPDPSFMNMNASMWGGGFPQQGMGMGGGFQNGMMSNGGFGQQNMPHSNMGNAPMNMNGMNGRGAGVFAIQQRSGFGKQLGNDEDGAYFRKPVNPHRHQGRRNINRPADYREI